MALPAKKMREREFAHLLRGGLDQFLIAVTERRAPQPGHAFNVSLALLIVDPHSLAALEHQRAALTKCRKIGIGMDESLDVAGGEVAGQGHELLLLVKPNCEGSALSRQSFRPEVPLSSTLGRGGGSGIVAAISAAAGLGSRTSHWHMRYPRRRSARST